MSAPPQTTDLGEGPTPPPPPSSPTAERRPAPRTESWQVPAAVAVALTGGAVLTVVVPALTMARRHHVQYMPDLWETALATGAASHAQQLVGAWSRIGLFHPGPAWFYAAAPVFGLTGRSASSLALAAALVVATSAIALVARVWRSVDALGAAVVAAVVAVAVHQLGVNGLIAPWNPTVLIVPVALGAVCAADAIHRGSLWSMAGAIASGTFAAQAHLGALGLGMGIVAVAVVGGVRTRSRTNAATPASAIVGTAALVALAVVPWIPPLIDQAHGQGNLGAVATYVTTGRAPEGAKAETGRSLGMLAAARQVGSIASLAATDTASWAGIDLDAGRDHDPTPVTDLATVALVALAAGCAFARPRHGATPSTLDDDRAWPLARWICRIGLAGLVVEVLGAWQVRDAFRPYTLASAAGIGLALWVGVVLGALALVRSRTGANALRIELVSALAVAAIGGIALAVTSTLIATAETPDRSDAVAAVEARADGRPIEIRVPDEAMLTEAMRMIVAIEADGPRVAAGGEFVDHFSDRQRRFHPVDPLTIDVVAAGSEEAQTCRVIEDAGEAVLCEA